MTTSILRPNATTTAATSLTGGATTHAVLSDDSDASYATHLDPYFAVVSFDTVTLPAGAVTKTCQLRVRARADSGTSNFQAIAQHTTASVAYVESSLTTTIATYAGAANPVSLTQAQVDAISCSFWAPDPATIAARFIEIYLDLVYATIPVANVTFPTGAPSITTTNKPTFTWTHTPGSDGGSQTHYQVKVFTAAVIGGGGFSADTSTPVYNSGIVVGSLASQESSALATGVSYGVYVRTAQTINGVAHWSVWDSETFSISVTTSDVSAITATPFGDGRILVAVDRSGSAWDFVEVQRSIDAGVTWGYVRGGEYVPPATTTVFSTGGANDFDINDWEVANGTMVLYRARATRILSGLPITGAWVQSSPATAWTSGEVWLKAPDEPALNRTVRFATVPGAGFGRRQGAIAVLNRPNPVVISDVLSGGAGTLTFQTGDDAEMRDLFALLRKPVLLLHPTPGWAIGAQYIAPGDVQQDPLSPRVVLSIRRFEVLYHQVDAPADSLAGSP